MTGYNARLTINGKEIPLAKVTMTPALDPALESAASALRADLAARGIPADELPEEVVLALAVVVERIAGLEQSLARLEDRTAGLRRVGPVPTPSRFLRPALDAARDQIQERLVEASREVTRRVRDESRQVPADTPPEAPRFRHDCPDCVFLGRSVCGTQDLYYCEVDWMPRHVSVRWGNVDDDDNKERFVTRAGVRGFSATGDWPDPHLADAYRRAVTRRRGGGGGEGEGG
jgi:hypothetical protein